MSIKNLTENYTTKVSNHFKNAAASTWWKFKRGDVINVHNYYDNTTFKAKCKNSSFLNEDGIAEVLIVDTADPKKVELYAVCDPEKRSEGWELGEGGYADGNGPEDDEDENEDW